MTLVDVFAVVKDGGTLAVLILIIVSGAQGRWVWGYQYRSALREKDEWKNLALSGTSLADRATTYAETDARAQQATRQDRDV